MGGAATAEIVLHGGLVALVDAADLELLSKYAWHARRSAQYAERWYAGHSYRNSEGRNRSILMHRLILGAKSGELVDHRDGDSLNNTRANIRICTAAQNAANRGRKRAGPGPLDLGACPYKGAYRHGRRWRAMICVNGVTHHLGGYATAEEAARAYDVAAVRLHGEFARLNFPEAA